VKPGAGWVQGELLRAGVLPVFVPAPPATPVVTRARRTHAWAGAGGGGGWVGRSGRRPKSINRHLRQEINRNKGTVKIHLRRECRQRRSLASSASRAEEKSRAASLPV
jgi:hypothetical protein